MEKKLTLEEMPAQISEMKATLNVIEKLLNNHPSFKDEVPDKLLTVDEASEFTSLARQTIYGLVSDRKIPFVKRQNGKRLYFSKKDLREWILGGRNHKDK